MSSTFYFSRPRAERFRAVCLLIAVLAWNGVACKQSSESSAADTTTPERAAQAPLVDPGDIQEQSVVPYESAEVGAVEVKSINAQPVDWFDVLQNGKRAFAGNPPLLNSSIELPPGAYIVDVNRTQRQVTIQAGGKTILWTGDLVVNGEPHHAFWYPMQGNERKLSSNPSLFSSARALFPGTYTVFVYVSVTSGDELLGEAEVKAGKKTELKR